MDNPKKGELSFEAEGETFTLQYSTESLIQLEEEQGRGIIKVLREVESWTKSPDEIRLGLVRSMLWAGLQSHHPEVTKRQAAELINKAGGILPIINLVGEAFQRAFSAPGTKGTRPPEATMKNGTGMTSSSSTLAMDTLQEPSGNLLPGN